MFNLILNENARLLINITLKPLSGFAGLPLYSCGRRQTATLILQAVFNKRAIASL